MNFSISARHCLLRFRHSPIPVWLKISIIVAASGGLLFLLINYWWALALVAIGYVLGASAR